MTVNDLHGYFIGVLLLQILAVSGATFTEVKDNIYCEKCHVYMWPEMLCCWPLDSAREALLLLSEWKLDDLNILPKVGSTVDDRIEFTLWKCRNLQDCVFYINAVAYRLIKYKGQFGQMEEKKWEGLIFSSPIKPIFAKDLQDKLKS